jgi:hypothetical protein
MNILAKRPPPSLSLSALGSPYGALRKKSSVSRVFHFMSLGVLSIGALHPGSPHSAPMERRSSSRALFRPSLKDPGKQAPLNFPKGVHMERDVRFQSDILE